MKKFYITTAIDYVNGRPHIGHAYEKIIADVLARWHRIKGEDVFFLTGTDDNAQKNAEAAKEARKPIKQFVNDNAKIFQELCKVFNISNDYFIRTTEKRHIKFSQEIFSKSFKKGDIYKGKYEGYYCLGCEAFLTEKDLVDEKCPEHNKKPEWREEESYFFKLSKYKDKIISLVSSKDFIIPKDKKNEILARLKSEELKDLSVSRKNTEWGIITPIDKEHSIYVWYDALGNYVSALDYPKGKKFKKYWPADVHVIGKGINWFHSVIWPAILFSANITQPKRILVHGYLTVNGSKISKSLGNSIDPIELATKYPADSIRYVLLREVSLGDDGDFSEEALTSRHNNELANDLGNLVSRVLTLAEKNFSKGLKKSQVDKKLFSKLNIKKIDSLMENFEINNALSEVWKFINECNKHINQEKPWEMKGKELEKHIYSLLESIRILSILLSPFLPETSNKILKQLNQKSGKLKDAKPGLVKIYKVKKSDILFKKIEATINVIETNKIKEYYIDQELKKQGINVAMALVSNANVSNKESYLKSIKEEISQKLQKKDISNKKILDGYKEFYVKAEVNGCVPAPENLINVIQKNKSIPNINTVVDCYNVISAETLLSFGAHDTSSIKGSISFRVTGGSEKFIPLGEKQPIKINKGEYAFMDDEEILCRMDIIH